MLGHGVERRGQPAEFVVAELRDGAVELAGPDGGGRVGQVADRPEHRRGAVATPASAASSAGHGDADREADQRRPRPSSRAAAAGRLHVLLVDPQDLAGHALDLAEQVEQARLVGVAEVVERPLGSPAGGRRTRRRGGGTRAASVGQPVDQFRFAGQGDVVLLDPRAARRTAASCRRYCRRASSSRPDRANWNDESIRSSASLSRNMARTLS